MWAFKKEIFKTENITLTNYFTLSYDDTTCLSACTEPVIPIVNSVEWFGDPYIGEGGDPSGGFYQLNGTVEIIGDSVTFRAFVYIPDNAGPGSFSSSIYIGDTDYRYVEVVRPRDVNNEAVSTSFTLPEGTYNWEVNLNWFGTGGGGEGGIAWTYGDFPL